MENRVMMAQLQLLLAKPLMKRYAHLFVIGTLLLVSYYPVLSVKQTVNPDAHFILPTLDEQEGVFKYLQSLLKFEMIDFQPIRDLSFAVDQWIYRDFRINISIWQNLIWWLLSCHLIFKLIDKTFTNLNHIYKILLLSFFSTYPIFSQTIAWGIARKHLMAFYFLVLFITKFFEVKDFSFKNSVKISFIFLLSLLSQPIHLFASCWVYIYLKIKKNLTTKNTLMFTAPMFFSSFILGLVNFFYYKYSSVYLHFYPSKNNDFDISDLVLAIGHYFFQMLFPYILSFDTSLGEYTIFIGLILFVCFLFWIYKKPDINQILWVTLGLPALIIILKTPTFVYDTYLLGPTLGLFFFFCLKFSSAKKKSRIFILLIPVVIFNILFVSDYSTTWTSKTFFTKKNFETRPNCLSANNYLMMTYEDQIPPPSYLKHFIAENQCLKKFIKTPEQINQFNHVKSRVFFYEASLPLNERETVLKSLANEKLIFSLALTAHYIKENKIDLADDELNKTLSRAKGHDIKFILCDKIVEIYVTPHCQRKNWKECLELTAKIPRCDDYSYL